LVKNIIFDFDGVILDSIPIKTEAYRILFHEFQEKYIEKIVEYHKANGGISRYKKIKYFFKEILNQEISEEKILNYAIKYSRITKEELTKEKYIIQDSFNFIKSNYQNYNMHIASGADESDLKYICDKLYLTKYFISINGSPKEKNKIVKNILRFNHYKNYDTILIGDSINDYEAAKKNSIKFLGYNNKSLVKVSSNYLIDFTSFSNLY